jgi:tRNA threonylcarbamoyl adenosine modification protein (Sua5/YciO/YrdC/YwlC family)
MSERFDCSDPEQRAAGLAAAADAVRRGELVVLPTDTVYGVGADAFTPAAVAGLFSAKRRGRDMPPPVLVGSVRAATALVEDLSEVGKDFINEFWPGGLTLVCRAQPTLSWDLGHTKGTVAVRMPLHPVALDLLKEVGPLAVSSANLHGAGPALTADDAEEQLGDSVAVLLDAGRTTGGVPSTILDLTGLVPRLLREGAIPIEKLRSVAAVTLNLSMPPAAYPSSDDEDEEYNDEDDVYDEDEEYNDEDDVYDDEDEDDDEEGGDDEDAGDEEGGDEEGGDEEGGDEEDGGDDEDEDDGHHGDDDEDVREHAH